MTHKWWPIENLSHHRLPFFTMGLNFPKALIHNQMGNFVWDHLLDILMVIFNQVQRIKIDMISLQISTACYTA
jgi:hypothetical protein